MLYDEQGQGNVNDEQKRNPFLLRSPNTSEILIIFCVFFPLTVKEVIYFLVPIAQW